MNIRRSIYALVMAGIMLGAGVALTSCIGAGDNTEIIGKGEGFFPKMKGIDLHGAERVIPADLQGRYQLLTIAFEREQQKQVNGWVQLADRMLGDYPDVFYYEIPVIYEMKAASRLWINNAMRSGIAGEQARERTITVYTDRDLFTSLLDMDMTTIHTLLINEEGRILWRASGVARPELRDTLQQVLGQLTAPTTGS